MSGLSCSVQASAVWATGYQGDVTVTNNGNSATSGWCVELGFDEAEGVSTLWSASLVDESSTLTICDSGWNGALTPGQSTTFGFTDTHGGSVTLPTCSATPN
ncbi:MAG TPA: cellulose binding domain-containing protein [Gammaproteobacteria bacterium]